MSIWKDVADILAVYPLYEAAYNKKSALVMAIVTNDVGMVRLLLSRSPQVDSTFVNNILCELATMLGYSKCCQCLQEWNESQIEAIELTKLLEILFESVNF